MEQIMNPRTVFVASAIAFACACSTTAFAQGRGKATVMPASAVKWADAGVPGVSVAAADGDMKKGASHFFLRYAAGFKAPLHHHSPDHHVVTVTGNLALIVDGKENSLPPGSAFSLRNKAPHAVRCEGSQDCVMFIDARGRWDVVAEK
jgi:quercetin dioxygenase-like cupin family protein